MPASGTPKRTLENPSSPLPLRDKRQRQGASPFDSPPASTFLNGHQAASNTLRSSLPPPNGADYNVEQAPYQPGAIRRVKLRNFVTYSSVEFFPGPSLNMVIGPNGTGKSTLVCAICIGLGYDPKYLGRAKDVSEFVKHGSSQAFIEIELQGARAGKPHAVVQCTIKRDGNRAMYNVNGKPMTAKKVKESMAKLGVQIDNLCQFLPQDRVVEFAGMTPVELLRSTQRAVASQAMLDWHDQLKTLRRRQRELEQAKQTQDEELASLEAQHRRQEADVQRIRERQHVKEEIRKLNAIRPLVEYEEKVGTVKAAKAKADEIKAELAELEEAVEPALREANEKEEYKKAIEEATDDRKREARRQLTEVQRLDGAVDEVGTNISQCEARQDNIRREQKECTARVTQARKEVRDLEARIAQGSSFNEEAMEKMYDNIRSLTKEEREAAAASDRLTDERNALAHQIREKDGRIRQHEGRLRDLNSKAGQQLQKLANINSDTAKAWNWIRQNQQLFEKQIYGPPMLECSVRNAREVDMVESMIPPGEMLMITTQTKADFLLLQQKLREMRLSRVNQRLVIADLQRFRPPVPAQELQRFGMEGYLIEHIEGPEVCLASLCEGAKIHLAGFASREPTDDEYQATVNSNMAQWVTPGGSYRITRRREYGPGATTITTRAIGRARHWTDDPVDVATTQGIKEEMAHLQADKNELEIAARELDSNRRRELTTRREELQTELRNERNELARFQKAKRDLDALPVRLDQAQQRHRDCIERHQQAQAQFDECIDEYTSLISEKATAALAHASGVENARLAIADLQEAQLMLIEATSDAQALAERTANVTSLLHGKQSEDEAAQRTWKALRTEVKALANRLRSQLAGEQATDIKTFFASVRDRMRTISELEAELGSQQARLSLLAGDDSSGRVLRAYEDRAARIDALREKTAEYAAAGAEVSSKVTSIRARWEPRLDGLVARISAAFEWNMGQINCAGEVAVVKDEDDYEAWAIAIRVKFRENEPLSQLDAHRQSGGERAVSTIFYLMSLQALTRSPFRVVDEINQGMDPRNERLVHARMVSIATGRDEMPVAQTRIPVRRRADDDDDDDEEDGEREREPEDGGEDGGEEDMEEDDEEVDEAGQLRRSGSQYFLITPKLLPGLRYESGMRVLCIGSGEHMPPAEKGLVDFEKALQVRAKGLAAMAAG